MSEHSWKFFGVGGFDQVSLTTGEDIAHSDFLIVGRNGVFYHRKGQDWDATITKIVEQPINVRQASWSPYKKVARFVTSQIEKFAGERAAQSDTMMQGAVTVPPGGSCPAERSLRLPPVFAVPRASRFGMLQGLTRI